VLDLLIIGAGPAGAAAAIEAASAGLSSLTIDKAQFPRDKCCGDGLTAGALRHLEALGVTPQTVPSWQRVEKVKVAGPNRRLHDFELPANRGQFAAIARRSELDHALVKRARQAGAKVVENATLEAIRISGAGTSKQTVLASFNGEQVQARHAIAADGMWSPTRKLLGLTEPGQRGEWHAFRQYFHNVSPAASTDLHVWFEEDLLPGYFWAFPLADNSVNVGFGIQRGSGHRIQSMKRLWPDLLSRSHLREVLGPDATPEAPHKAWPIPARLGRAPLTAGPVFFVGDAAGATDPMTGEGIGQALETGRLAVSCLADRARNRPSPMAWYEQTLRSGMAIDHRLAEQLARVLATRRGAQWSVNVAGLTDWTSRNFARWLFEDYPRAVLATPTRWRRNTFKADGAFYDFRSVEYGR